jgi:hypothetical protein
LKMSACFFTSLDVIKGIFQSGSFDYFYLCSDEPASEQITNPGKTRRFL